MFLVKDMITTLAAVRIKLEAFTLFAHICLQNTWLTTSQQVSTNDSLL